MYKHYKRDQKFISFNQGRRDLEAKEALPQGPPENRGKQAPPPKVGAPRNFVISIKFSIRLLKAREEIKPNKVIKKSELVKKFIV